MKRQYPNQKIMQNKQIDKGFDTYESIYISILLQILGIDQREVGWIWSVAVIFLKLSKASRIV